MAYKSWITRSELKLALVVYPDLFQMYMHTQLTKTIFCFHTLNKAAFLILRATPLIGDFLNDFSGRMRSFCIYVFPPNSFILWILVRSGLYRNLSDPIPVLLTGTGIGTCKFQFFHTGTRIWKSISGYGKPELEYGFWFWVGLPGSGCSLYV